MYTTRVGYKMEREVLFGMLVRHLLTMTSKASCALANSLGFGLLSLCMTRSAKDM